MFLTTDRPDTFDPAFESRIHLTINYPKLNYASRLQIWQTFLPVADEPTEIVQEISQADLERIAKHEMNGRQIKNVVETANLLAVQGGSPLLAEHIETVLRVKSGQPGNNSS